MEKEFKCKDEVIYRSKKYEYPIWTYGIFSHYEHRGGNTYAVISGNNGHDVMMWDILPYEGNEHLVGKTVDVEHVEEVVLEQGEWLMVFFHPKYIPFDCCLRKFEGIEDGNIKVYNDNNNKKSNWLYAIRFSDFNIEDIDETRKHILYVDNNRIVKRQWKEKS